MFHESQAPPGVNVFPSQKRYIYLLNQLVNSTQRGKRRRTSGFPLTLIHFSLAVRIDDVHPLEQGLKFRVILELLKNIVEFLLVDGMQAKFRSESRKKGE